MTILSVFIKHRKELLRAKRLDAWYRRMLRKRDEGDFAERWLRQGGVVNYELIRDFADIMEFPNYYIFPHDRSSVLFFTPYADLREVEAIRLLEENGVMGLNEVTIHERYKYAKDIFASRVAEIFGQCSFNGKIVQNEDNQISGR